MMGNERNEESLNAIFDNTLFGQIKKYMDENNPGSSRIYADDNIIHFRTLTVEVNDNGYQMYDDTFGKHFEGNTIEDFKEDYWKWANPF